ncbi:MAG: hypothetical protein K2X47_17645 [Bdellovibrionales bacterium]|nr:hypothetical protein [Bdellovibrionales bacterium]
MMVLLVGLVIANFIAGFLLSIGSVNSHLGLVFGCFSVLFWMLLREQNSGGTPVPSARFSADVLAPAKAFPGWSAMSKLEFAETSEADMVPEVLTSQTYRYRVQFIAWPPTIRGACSLADLELFLQHLRLRRQEQVLILTQLDSKTTIADVLRLSSTYGVTLISDIESRMKRESLPDSEAFHRILIFGPAEKRVRWEIALHGLFDKKPTPLKKTETEIQV